MEGGTVAFCSLRSEMASTEKKVLVSYNDSKKVIVVHPDLSREEEMVFLLEKCKKLFLFGGNESSDQRVQLQAFDSEWDAWVDVDDSYSLRAKEKLKLVVLQSLPTVASFKATQEFEVSTGLKEK